MGFLSSNNGGGRRWSAGRAVDAIPAAARMLSLRSKKAKVTASEGGDSLSVDGLSDGSKETGDNEQSEETVETLQCGEGHHDIFYNKFAVSASEEPTLETDPPPEIAPSSRLVASDEFTESQSAVPTKSTSLPARRTDSVEGTDLRREERFDDDDDETNQQREGSPGNVPSGEVPEQRPRDRGGQRRSRSQSQTAPPRPGPPRLLSQSIRAKKTDEPASVDSRGGCARHPFVQLRCLSRRTGEWKALLDSCPLCVEEDNNSSTVGSSAVGSSPKRASTPQRRRQQQHQERSRPRSQSISRPRYCPVDTDDYVDDAPQDVRPRRFPRSRASSASGSSSDASSAASWDEEDIEDDVEEGATTLASDVKPLMWISCDDNDLMTEGEDVSIAISEALAMMENTRSDNDAIHESAREAMQLASGMGRKMEDLVLAHEASVRDYEGRLARMEEELRRREGLAAAVEALREENEVLRAMVIMGEEEVDESRGDHERELTALIAEKEEAHREEVGRVTLEREEARRAREELQREVELLRRELERSRRPAEGHGNESPCSLGEPPKERDEQCFAEETTAGGKDVRSSSKEYPWDVCDDESFGSLEEAARGYDEKSLCSLEEAPKRRYGSTSPSMNGSTGGREDESRCSSEEPSNGCNDESFCSLGGTSKGCDDGSYCSLEGSPKGRDEETSRSVEESPKGVDDEISRSLNCSFDVVWSSN